MPARHLVRTVLPAPLSPHSAVTSREGRSRSTLYKAWTAPKCFSSPLTLSSGSLALGSALAAVMVPALSPVRGGAAAKATAPRVDASSYEVGMLFAVQTAAVT